MPRPLRPSIPGAYYHVTIRGNRRQRIFQDAVDYRAYLAELAKACQEFSCRLLVYALMPNHVHLVLYDRPGTLSRFMQVLNARYTRHYNQRHNVIGHLYQGRFYAKVITQDAYLLQVSRYVHLNPVRARLVARPEEYLWSSYRAYVASEPTALPLERQLIWNLMGEALAQQQPVFYRHFVEQMTPEQLPSWENWLRQLHLIGSCRFAKPVSDTSSPLSV